MSRSSSRRPSNHSRGSSSHGHRSLSVTEALQSIRLTETVGGTHAGLPSYPTSTSRRRPSYRDEISAYRQSPYESTTYSSSTLDPSVLESYPTYDEPSYPDQPTSTANPYLSTSETMRYVAFATAKLPFADAPNSYPSYSQAPLSNPYRPDGSSRSSTNYGKLAALTDSDPSSRRRLNEAGYTNPRTEASMSRSMSGPSLPSVPPRAYEEVRNVGREFVERRRHNVYRPRRQKKLIMRQAVLPSSSRTSREEDMSGSIDSFLAHSSSSYESPPSYVPSSSHGPYGSSTRG